MILLMAQALGYNFTQVEIGRELYSPKAHAKIETDQMIIREGLAAIFRGDRAFPLDIKAFPDDPDLRKNISNYYRIWTNFLPSKFDPNVIIQPDIPAPGHHR